MKKLLVLVVLPVLLFFTACDCNKPCPDGYHCVKIDSVVAQPDIITPPSSDRIGDDGAPGGSPAQVFDDVTLVNIEGAQVVAKEGTRTIATATTNSSGIYVINGPPLLVGHTYSFTCTKTGYLSQTKIKVYENAESLPWFSMKLP